MDYKAMYQQWLDNPYFDEETKAELKAIEGNEKEIEDRFYMDLEFGTAGRDWGRHKPHERIHSQKSNTGTGELYPVRKGRSKRGGNCIRFQAHVSGICRRSSVMPGSKRH